MKKNGNMKNGEKVSVVIPTKNSANTLEACLRSITNQSYKNIEIIVVDNNSSDKTKKIASEYTTLVFNKGPERSTQRNFGAKKATGAYFLFIDSDMVLTENVVFECVMQIEKTNSNMVVIPESSFGKGFWAECKKLERSFYIGVEWMEAARFFDRKTFVNFGGYDEKNTGTEDYDLPQRILADTKFKAKQSRISAFILHDEGQLSLQKTLYKKFYYGKKIDTYKNTKSNSPHFKNQSSVLKRFALFFSNPKKLFAKPIVGVGMLTMKNLEFIFGGLGYITSKINKK